jgi:hypothetical protein
MLYNVTVPPTMDQGGFNLRVCDTYQSKAADALQDYNSARAHDGQEPLKRMPAGTVYSPIYVWEIRQYTGQEYGWEAVCQETTRKAALVTLREYRENQPEYPVKIWRRPATREEASL